MLSSEENKRYNRHLMMPEIGIVGQERLKAAKVLVIGAGGLGCPVLQYLAAAGVGTLGVVDFDVVDESNLQRQIFYSTDQIGKSKVLCAAEAVNRINPLILVEKHELQVTVQNAWPLVESYDIVVDGTDNFKTRYMINDLCYLLKKPLVFGAIHRFQGQVSVFHLTEDSPTYRTIFPIPPLEGTTANCSEIGVLSVLPGIIGSIQAAEVIKIITRIGEPLDGRILHYDALDQSFFAIEISGGRDQTSKIQPSENEFFSHDYSLNCTLEPTPFVKIILSEELEQNHHKYRIIDIREPCEEPKLVGFLVEYWPLSLLETQPLELDGRQTVIFCQRGLRSKAFVSKWLENDPSAEIFSLLGGVEALA